jgi:DNA polymerase eta
VCRYRDASVEVINVLKEFSCVVERASIDEAYLDVTDEVERRLLTFCISDYCANLQDTFVVGWNNDELTCKESK